MSRLSAPRRAPLRARPLALACAGALALLSVHAARAQSDGAATLAPVIVTGNPLGDTLSQPSTVLSGDALDLRHGDTLGDTLNGLPGISTTSYGPMVGRPIIRGMDGDRIRLLNNGIGSLDASSLSYDHQVPTDPMAADRIEILRGPAALLYGGNAIGGVVNTIDNRIPTEAVDGVQGQVQSEFNSANDSRSGGARVEAGDGNFALHADVFGRETNELRIPGDARSARLRARDPDTPSARDRLPNSDGRDSGGAIGMGWTGDSGYAGLSYSGYDSNYGSVAEPDVRIKLRQQRFNAAGELRDLGGLFTRVTVGFGYTDYQHKEIEDGETGTIFQNRGYDARIEAQHADIGPVRGVLGLQLGQTRFSALGEEALVPTVDTDSLALFDMESWKVNERLTLSAGARAELTRLSPAAGGNERFAGSGRRRFTAGSFSLGGVYQLDPIWSLAANASYTERAPTFYELYANGPHEATGQYLVGNADLRKERAWSSDLALRWKKDANRGSVGVFYSRFGNYLAELNTGRLRDDDGEPVAPGTDNALPEAFYRGVRAEFYGIEAESSTRLYAGNGHALDLSLGGDYTHARNADTGEPLPRIAPLRLMAGLDWRRGAWDAGVSVTKAFAQHRQPEADDATDGYYSLDAHAGYRFKLGATRWQAYVRGINLTNQEIRYATSVLRDEAPQGGRAVLVGLRGNF
ncbi:TonB-dependent receptor [Bordetella genomosp. 1]|uniref:TonB-dependent receptor n=1 Tax=Bordetella genomosp. 1 TaxID=1395607 RepID=A0ABX4EZC7_9BORD|nr:TonB-dependent receptor [Bordetella genomosp. 1]OZI65085.1 TonB-dependent receptor [Bordetella genomosp. 1]